MRTTIECGFSGRDAAKKLVTYGPTILVDIGFDPAWDPGAKPAPGNRDVSALIDTGAQECFIDCNLADLLNLPVVGPPRSGWNPREIRGRRLSSPDIRATLTLHSGGTIRGRILK